MTFVKSEGAGGMPAGAVAAGRGEPGARLDMRRVALHFALFLSLVAVAWSLPSGRFVLVLTNPAASPGESVDVIAAAGGSFVSSGRYPWMVVAYSDDTDFPARLMKAGAMLVLNHQLAVGCFKKEDP